MKNLKNYYYKKMPNPNLGIDIIKKENLKNGKEIKTHWHEHMQVYFFIAGKALLECNNKKFYVGPKSVTIINSSELHYLKSLSDDLTFYVIRVDFAFLFSSQADLCQIKFISPLAQNQISFKNLIENDNEILNCISLVIEEYFLKKAGYELAVKSYIYQLIVILLRKYINKFLTQKEFESKLMNLKRFDLIFKYINENYSQKISTSDLSKIVHVSVYHFCRIFKQITGKTSTEYINMIRMEKACDYLRNRNLNITEIAIRCGFDNMNYFSRLFRKKYSMSPTQFRKSNLKL